MRIIAFVNKNSGPGYHRIITPLLLMQDVDVFVTNNLLEEHFEKGVDIFMYNRILPDHAMPKIKELQQRYGFRICIDLDDHWELDEHHVLYEEYQAIDFAGKQIEQLRNADVVLLTHDRLAEEVRPFNANVHICPNAIPKTGQFVIERKPSDFTRLFWQGSDTHRADISLLREPIDKLAKISPKIKMVMGGYAENHEHWYHMVHDYTAGLKHQYKLIPYAPIDQYYAAYAEADICLIPLLNSRFNRHKSNLKILEAANAGLPVIVSQVHPYLDMPVNYCRRLSDWVGHIKRLVNWPKRREEEGLRLQEYCDTFFNFEKINAERKQIFEYESKRVGV